MKNICKTVLATMLLLGLGTISVAQNANASDPFQRFYHENCIPEAKKAGLNQAEAAQGCKCTVDSLKNKYSTPAFTTLFNQYRNGNNGARVTLTRYGTTCFEKILDNILFEN